MTVRIRMKKFGRRHRPFFRVCAMDARAPRDGRVIEELGYYDPMVGDTDARAILNGERIEYWLSVGAQPTEKVRVLIKKYGKEGTRLEQQKQAIERLGMQVAAAAEEPSREQAAPEQEAASEDQASEAPSSEQAPSESAQT